MSWLVTRRGSVRHIARAGSSVQPGPPHPTLETYCNRAIPVGFPIDGVPNPWVDDDDPRPVCCQCRRGARRAARYLEAMAQGRDPWAPDPVPPRR